MKVSENFYQLQTCFSVRVRSTAVAALRELAETTQTIKFAVNMGLMDCNAGYGFKFV